jgi:four helix bundle protein
MLDRKDNVILNKTIAFSLAIIEYAEQLEEQKKYVVSRQLLRSGTSIGANVH